MWKGERVKWHEIIQQKRNTSQIRYLYVYKKREKKMETKNGTNQRQTKWQTIRIMPKQFCVSMGLNASGMTTTNQQNKISK